MNDTDCRPVSGLSAAHTVYLAGGNVLLLDKNSMYLYKQVQAVMAWHADGF